MRIKGLAGEPCRVRPGMNGEVRIRGSRQFKLKQVSRGIYELDIKKGEEVMLFAANEK